MASQPDHPNQQRDDQLCGICSRLDFRGYRYHRISGTIKLGTWRDIVQTQSCPFCRLVVKALTVSHAFVSRDLDDVVLLGNHVSWELGIERSPYDRLKSEAYSNKFDLKSVAKRCEKLVYRLVISIRSRPEEIGYIQYVAFPTHNGSDDQFFGRAIDRRTVRASLLRSWVRRCEGYHHKTCEDDGIAGRRLPNDLRLIDIRRMLLIRAPANQRLCYVTLSYVWGTELMEQETRMKPVVTNQADLQKNENGEECTPLPAPLPRTIEDAIWLTREMGYRYLWIDALCIVQDDPIEDKKRHLERMDAVYNHSKLTIVAASGLHANTGLPGVSAPRKNSQHSEDVKRFRMAAMSPSFSDLENSRTLIWNTRGWTFQEKVLAKRILLLTDYQVYYRCSESIWTEEIYMETESPSKSIETRYAKYRWAADRLPHVPSQKLLLVKMVFPRLNVNDEWNYLGKFPDYVAAIREYSQRQLTDPGDTLLAVDGVLRTLQIDTGNFISGLPESHLLQSLLWHPETGTCQTRVNLGLTTWTWASWRQEKGIVFDVLDVRLLRIIILTIRNVMVRSKEILSKMMKGSSSESSDNSSGSSSGSSSSTSSSSHTSSSSSSSSGPVLPPPLMPWQGRNWTTMTGAGKATMNVALCFGLPLMFRHHTVKHVFLYENGKARELEHEAPLSLSTFTQVEKGLNGDTDERSEKSPRASTTNPRSKVHRHHEKMAANTQGPVLAMMTMIVKLTVGACLSVRTPQDENEIGVFELLEDGLCVGEVWTTLGQAKRGRNLPTEFLTISWGLSFQAAEIAEQWVPRWTIDATVLPSSRTKLLLTCIQAVEEVMSWNSGKHIAGTYGARKSSTPIEEQPSVMSFFNALLGAKKGEPRPKFLWSTVNLLMIERKNGTKVATRIGVGRVIFEAWLFQWADPEEVILA